MRSTFTLGRLAGVEVGFNWSWLIVVALVGWSLAGAVFPANTPGLAGTTYAIMAVIAGPAFPCPRRRAAARPALGDRRPADPGRAGERHARCPGPPREARHRLTTGSPPGREVHLPTDAGTRGEA